MADEAWFNTWLNEFLKRAQTLLAVRVQAGKMNADEAAATLELLQQMNDESLRHALISLADGDFDFRRAAEFCKCLLIATIPSSTHSPADAFAAQLKARQGTVMPDFESLYRHKDELDRKFFRPEAGEPDASG
jgi:hypothetical protein